MHVIVFHQQILFIRMNAYDKSPKLEPTMDLSWGCRHWNSCLKKKSSIQPYVSAEGRDLQPMASQPLDNSVLLGCGRATLLNRLRAKQDHILRKPLEPMLAELAKKRQFSADGTSVSLLVTQIALCQFMFTSGGMPEEGIPLLSTEAVPHRNSLF